ncbi:MAG TPA: hypothetical protein VF599_20765 [Pyrinomonadaceae bacterium]|jgi:hypothetical protein
MEKGKALTNLTIIVILLTFGFGCQGFKSPFGGAGGVSESTDPKDAVQAAFRKFMDAKFYHSIVKTKNAQAEIETEIDFNAPDRFWIKNNISNYNSEIIITGGDSYSRTNDGKWTKMPAGQAPSAKDMRGSMTDEYFTSMKDFEAAGRENLNGKETVVYKFKSSYGGESASKVWVATDTGLPLRVDTEGVYGGTPVQTSIVYDYDKETKIEAPKLVNQ